MAEKFINIDKFKEGLADILLKPWRAYDAVTGSPEVTVYIHGASVSQILDRVDILINEISLTKPVPPIPQEPKNPYPDENAEWSAWEDCVSAYRPLLEQAEQRVKELEEERDNWAKEAGRRSAKDIEKINALESQLKDMVELDEIFKTYDEYINLLAESEASLIGLAFAHGYRTPQKLVDKGTELRKQIEILKVKALTSTEKGGTK